MDTDDQSGPGAEEFDTAAREVRDADGANSLLREALELDEEIPDQPTSTVSTFWLLFVCFGVFSATVASENRQRNAAGVPSLCPDRLQHNAPRRKGPHRRSCANCRLYSRRGEQMPVQSPR